jgi:molybdate transport system substrate-binding protein
MVPNVLPNALPNAQGSPPRGYVRCAGTTALLRNLLLWIVYGIGTGIGVWSGSAAAGSPGSAETGTVTVFAAASLSDALAAIGHAYAGSNAGAANHARFSFAASSTLARQIEAGAPADLFASASTDWMDYLQERTLIDADSRVSPIGNELVLIAPADSIATVVALDQTTLDALLGTAGRLAMADPAHVPAGMYARQALLSLGLWGTAQPRAAFANDVRGVLALVERGEVPLGVVYATDAVISQRVRVLTRFPTGTHDPIRYSFALVAGPASAKAADLIAFMNSEPGLAIFRQHGFLTP